MFILHLSIHLNCILSLLNSELMTNKTMFHLDEAKVGDYWMVL